MNKKYSLLFILSLGLCLFSCKKDDENVSPDETKIPEKFSELTVEQNKSNLETNGIAMVNEMEDLKNTEGVKASISIVDFLSTNSPFQEDATGESSIGGRYFAVVKGLSLVGNNKASANEMFKTMRFRTDDPSSIKEYYDGKTGTYSWNKTAQQWDYVAGGAKIIFKFPSTKTGTANNAVYTIHSYTGTVVTNPLDESYTGDLPTGLLADLMVDGKKVVEYSFTAKYNGKGEPTFAESALSVFPFTFTATLVNEVQEVSLSYGLTRDKKVLIKIGAGANGNFDSNNIENAENEGEVINNGYAYFQLLNVKLSGNIDVKKVSDGYDLIYKDSDLSSFDEDAAVAKEAQLFNENVKLVVFYVDTQTKIADTEFYVADKEDNYCYYSYNYETDEYTEVCESNTFKAVDGRLVFKDGSKSDLANYVDNGFTTLTSDFEALIEDLENDFN